MKTTGIEEPWHDHFNERVGVLLVKTGIRSWAKLAERTGIGLFRLQRIYKGQLPTLLDAYVIAYALGVKVEDIFPIEKLISAFNAMPKLGKKTQYRLVRPKEKL